MGLNITFWNCQGIRSKRKELELYLKENSIDIIAFNETFLNKKVNFKIQGYDTIRNDRSTGSGGGVAFLVKHGLVVNKEFRNADFNIITDNEALAINLELSNNRNLTLATIYCPNGKPNLSLFQTICNLSDNVMFVGDFKSKSEAFGCASKNASGPILKTIQNTLDLIYFPKSKSVRPESNPISNETLALIKEKRKLRRQYSQMKDPAVKTRINQLQKQVKDDLRVESQASWEKFCNSISLEADSNESWRKIKNFLKPKGQRDYPTLHHATKVAKTNADKAQLFAESVERHFGIESEHFDSNQLRRNVSLGGNTLR